MSFSKNKLYRLLKKPYRIDRIFRQYPEIPRRTILNALEELVSQGLVQKNKKNFYAQSSNFGCFPGTFCATSRNYGFVSLPNKEKEDIFIPAKHCHGALEGDTVLVRLLENAKRNGRAVGAVVKILSRSSAPVVGTLKAQKDGFLLLPDSEKYPTVRVRSEEASGGRDGDKAAVSLCYSGSAKHNPQGTVTAIFGESGTMAASIAAILYENHISEPFSPAAAAQAENLSTTVCSLSGREDLRNKLIFTIDGKHSKDFDDAISLEYDAAGNYLLGIHIADVSHFVTPGSPLDAAAFSRGTSVYYADKVIPMLPVSLSNGICSLNPGEDRYAFSVFLTLDRHGICKNYRFCKSVIRSKVRMTYPDVNQLLQRDAALCSQYAFLTDVLFALDALAQKRYALRLQRGAIELGLEETVVVCDETGKAVGISAQNRGRGERLIEECMLLANESVAEFLSKSGAPAIYRIHPDPDPEKLQTYAHFAKAFGSPISRQALEDPAALQRSLEAVADPVRRTALSAILLRCLSKASYSPACSGHYGLGAVYYLHFTSPIRRYPDLVVHRMLCKQLQKEPFSKVDETFCAQAAAQSSERELCADTAERDIERLYIADYMASFLGEEFDGVISSVQSFGVFVRLHNSAEGMIAIDALPGRYHYDESTLTLFTSAGRPAYQIGDPIRVRLVNASNVSGRIDLEPVGV